MTTILSFTIDFHTCTATLFLTKKLPSAELKMAAASLPPTALVRMTAEETGGGMQPTTWSLRREESKGQPPANANSFIYASL